MYNVTEFPVDRLSDRELRLREWEVVMSGGYGSNEVTLELEGHVIVERFTSVKPQAFTGLSVSAPEPAREVRS